LWSGIDVPDEKFALLLGAAGAIGTLLVISNPLGRGLQNSLRNIFSKRKNSDFKSHVSNNFKYCIRAVDTNSIKIEIDKMVSLIYFATIIVLFSAAVTSSDTLAQSLVFKLPSGGVFCNDYCIKLVIPASATIFVGILIIVTTRDWPKVIHYTEIAGIYQLSISSPYVTQQSRDSMARPIELNDWRTAEEWAHIIEHEIKTERNKAEFISQSIQEVYRPLYEESMQISATISNHENSGRYGSLPAQAWPKIKTTPSHLLVENPELKQEIESFYELIRVYNEIPNWLERDINSVISKTASEFYKKDVANVQLWTRRKNGGGSAPALWDCIAVGKHPLEIDPQGEYEYISLELKNGKKEPLHGQEELKQFNKFFEIVKEKVKEETRLEKMKTLFKEIKQKHEKLKPKVEEQIKKQWL